MARAFGVVGLLVCGCSETFADQIREHRGCIGEAQIAPQRVDACLRWPKCSPGHRPQRGESIISSFVNAEAPASVPAKPRQRQNSLSVSKVIV